MDAPGLDAIRLVTRWLLDARGHHRLIIDYASRTNERFAAARVWASNGSGVMRRHRLDHTTGEWVNGPLLELLPDELT